MTHPPAFLISLAALLSVLFFVNAGCSTSERIVTEGEQQYKEIATTFLWFQVKKTRKPILSALQQAFEDLRQQKIETQSMYRTVALYCAIGAVALLVVGCLTKYGEATGAAAILGGSSLVCAWLSVALGLWWLVLIAAVLAVAIYVACKVRGFHAPDIVRAKLNPSKKDEHFVKEESKLVSSVGIPITDTKGTVS